MSTGFAPPPTSFEKALELVLAACPEPRRERVALEQASARFLATELRSRWQLPPYDNSAVDGYALRAADLSTKVPKTLPLASRIYAGQHEPAALAPGYCARITTGAPVPAGADSVVFQESTTVEGETIRFDKVARAGSNIRRAGEDIETDQLLASAGTRITPDLVAMLATFGHERVEVSRAPRVHILTGGDELVRASEAAPGRIVDSNSPMLAARVTAAGAIAHCLGIAPDDPEQLRERLAAAFEDADILLTIGGASVGDRDYTRSTLRELGVELAFEKVAMRPGKPTSFGQRDDCLVFALPGNPRAVANSFDRFVRPALRKMLGAKEVLAPRLQGRLAQPVSKRAGFVHFLPASAKLVAGELLVYPTPKQSSGMLSSPLGRPCSVVLPAAQAEFAAGDPVEIEIPGDSPAELVAGPLRASPTPSEGL